MSAARGESSGLRRLSVMVLAAISGLWAVSAGGAQSTAVSGTSQVTLSLSGRVELKQTAGLRISTSSLSFDFVDSPRAVGLPACVVGRREDDSFPNRSISDHNVAPGGTIFQVTTYPEIEIIGGGPVAPNLAPLPPTQGSVVCYRSFTLQTYTNLDGWSVLASRVDAPDSTSIRDLYIGSACRGEAARGLAHLGASVEAVLSDNRAVGSCGEMVVVIAVKLDSANAGTSLAAIRYTLVSELGDVGLQ